MFFPQIPLAHLKKALLISLLVSFSGVIIAQQQNLVWEKDYPAAGRNEVVHSITQAIDGSLIVVGTSYAGKKGDKNGLMLIIDPESGLLQKRLSFGGEEHDEIFAVQQKKDGTFVLAGYTESNGKKKRLVGSDLQRLQTKQTHSSDQRYHHY